MPKKKKVVLSLGDFNKQGGGGGGFDALPTGPSGMPREEYGGRGGRGGFGDRDGGRGGGGRYGDDEPPSRADSADRWRSGGSGGGSGFRSGGGGGGGGFGDRGGGGFGRDRDDRGGRFGDRDFGGGGFSRPSEADQRRGFSGGDRFSGGNDGRSGYKPLRLKKKGEVMSFDEPETKKKEEVKPKPKPERKQRNCEVPVDVIVPISQKQSKLDKLIAEGESVNVKVLAKDIAKLSLDEEKQGELCEVLAKSVNLERIKLAEAVNTLTEKVPETAAAVVTQLLQVLLKKKKEKKLLKMVSKSKLDVLDIIAKGLEGDKLQEFLAEKELLCLVPVADVSTDVTKKLEAEGAASVDAVLKLVNDEIDVQLSAASVVPAVSKYLFSQVFKGDTIDTDVIKTFVPLLNRCLNVPKPDFEAHKDVLFAAQKKWDKSNYSGNIKDIFISLHENELLTHEAFNLWKEDTKSKTKGKMKALLKVNSWIESITPIPVSEFDEDEGDEEEEEEYDGY